MQLHMAIMQDVKRQRRDVEWPHVKLCDTEQAAMRLCINKSQLLMRQRDIAETLGFKVGTLNTILNSDMNDRPRYMSRAKQEQLQDLCGNNAVNQWAELYSKGLLNCQKTVETRRAELERELAALNQQQTL